MDPETKYRHELEMTEQHTKLNTEINRLGGLEPGSAWKAVWEAEMRSLTERQRAETEDEAESKTQHGQAMEWCRYVLQELADPQNEAASGGGNYVKACRKQFIIIYDKLDNFEYKEASEFCQDIKSLYTTFGKQLTRLQRMSLETRWQMLLAVRSEWKPEYDVEMEMEMESAEIRTS
ncbi:uncharacterized protein RCC_10798 [Ramularia collo-cygni]|uniref:Uncharacterized protein n=1 Tax=Ramularia collo-cygni TaxID=112498 RepID=A0A2D3VRN3_9PEZI|nr:uncharacterized protein RCC_10798 [Ramularia collo-cygni]CZT25068.1 uncharacterized protein RCC_10798 [Ramularia collo-cygni]